MPTGMSTAARARGVALKAGPQGRRGAVLSTQRSGHTEQATCASWTPGPRVHRVPKRGGRGQLPGTGGAGRGGRPHLPVMREWLSIISRFCMMTLVCRARRHMPSGEDVIKQRGRTSRPAGAAGASLAAAPVQRCSTLSLQAGCATCLPTCTPHAPQVHAVPDRLFCFCISDRQSHASPTALA